MPPDQLSVVWVCESLAGIGGTEYLVMAFTKALAMAGARISIVVPADILPAWRKLADEEQIAICAVDASEDLLGVAAARCRQQQADVIQFVPWNSLLTEWRRYCPPGVATVVLEPTSADPACWWLPEDLPRGLVDGIAVLTRAAQDAIRPRAGQTPVVVIPNTIFPVTPLPTALTAPRRVTALARLSQEKGLDFLMAAMALLPTAYHDAELHLWGHGSERERLERLAIMLRIPERVHFRGIFQPVTGLRDAALGTWVAVLPSLFEGQPICLLEWMALGVPIIASRTSGAIATLGDDHPHLVAIGDSRGLAEQIAWLLDDPMQRQRSVERGHSHLAETCGIQRTRAALLAFYAQVLHA